MLTPGAQPIEGGEIEAGRLHRGLMTSDAVLLEDRLDFAVVARLTSGQEWRRGDQTAEFPAPAHKLGSSGKTAAKCHLVYCICSSGTGCACRLAASPLPLGGPKRARIRRTVIRDCGGAVQSTAGRLAPGRKWAAPKQTARFESARGPPGRSVRPRCRRGGTAGPSAATIFRFPRQCRGLPGAPGGISKCPLPRAALRQSRSWARIRQTTNQFVSYWQVSAGRRYCGSGAAGIGYVTANAVAAEHALQRSAILAGNSGRAGHVSFDAGEEFHQVLPLEAVDSVCDAQRRIAGGRLRRRGPAIRQVD